MSHRDRRPSLVLALIALVASPPAISSAQNPYNFGNLNVGGLTTVGDVNDNGSAIVGTANSGGNGSVVGFIQAGGGTPVYTTYPNTSGTVLTGVNTAGYVCGYANGSPFVLYGGTYTPYTYSGLFIQPVFTDINNNNTIAGYYTKPNNNTNKNDFFGMLTNGSNDLLTISVPNSRAGDANETYIGGLDDASDCVGLYLSAGNYVPFMRNGSDGSITVIPLPAGWLFNPRGFNFGKGMFGPNAISPHLGIVGAYTLTPGGLPIGFFTNGTTTVNVIPDNAQWSVATSITTLGVVVGYYADQSGAVRGFTGTRKAQNPHAIRRPALAEASPSPGLPELGTPADRMALARRSMRRASGRP